MMDRLYDGQWQCEDDQRRQIAMKYRIAKRALALYKRRLREKCNCKGCICKADDAAVVDEVEAPWL